MATATSLATTAAPRSAAAQGTLGHKLPGTAGLNAGRQPEPGVYVATRLLHYDATRLRDRDGNVVPVPDFDLDASAIALGVAGVLELDSGLHLGSAAAVPLARLSTSSADPRATVDRFGLGDLFVSPLQVGYRWQRFHALASYSVYVPTRQIQREGLGSPQWSHQLSAGGTAFFEPSQSWWITALVSFDRYQEKQDIEVTRGDSVQVQGGLGGSPRKGFEVGLAAYALWQVRDDRGRDLPDELRGRRDRVFGLGPEVGALIPRLRSKVGLRYTRDFGAEGRPEGQLVTLELTVRL